MGDRALKRLSSDEMVRIPKVGKTLAHNMQDAIMLGLVQLGLLGKYTEAPAVRFLSAPMT